MSAPGCTDRVTTPESAGRSALLIVGASGAAAFLLRWTWTVAPPASCETRVMRTPCGVVKLLPAGSVALARSGSGKYRKSSGLPGAASRIWSDLRPVSNLICRPGVPFTSKVPGCFSLASSVVWYSNQYDTRFDTLTRTPWTPEPEASASASRQVPDPVAVTTLPAHPSRCRTATEYGRLLMPMVSHRSPYSWLEHLGPWVIRCLPIWQISELAWSRPRLCPSSWVSTSR